jgi:large subunit ribosomal protein L20
MRVKRGTKCRKRHKKTLDRAEGFRGRTRNTFKQAVQRTEKAMTYEFRDRKVKKREFRALWVTRINAAARLNGLSYSRLIAGLKAAKVEVDRKVLADLGAYFPSAFTSIAEVAKKALAAA